MEWILNDLSLEQQFVDMNDFIKKMTVFLQAKNSHTILNQHLLCSRQLGSVKVVGNITFSQAVMRYSPPTLKRQLLSWVNKHGPFWEDYRVAHEDDYFECHGIDVTDQGLGECARRAMKKLAVCSYSFTGQFNHSPITIQHGLVEEPMGSYDINNIWTADALITSARQSLPVPENWAEAIERLIEEYPCLTLSNLIFEQMAPVPYSLGNYYSIRERFRVLENYLDSRDDVGRHTKESNEILINYFQGEKSWFSDSSESEYREFENALSFKDLFNHDIKLFPFHGKIKTPQLRIHFEWPIAPECRKIQIVYIGPKLTKR